MKWFFFSLFLIVNTVSVFARPLPDLIFVQIPTQAEPDSPVVTYLNMDMNKYVDGARIVIYRPFLNELVNLTPEFTAACDPDVSFDGGNIAFAGKRKPEDTWQIWTMKKDGSQKIKITQEAGDCFAPVYAGTRFYLNDPQPTPQIIFVGTGHGWKNINEVDPVLALYSTDLDGNTTRRLTFNLHSDFSPDILPNGRIVFTSMQIIGDRYNPTEKSTLMAINNDGTDLMSFYEDHEAPVFMDMVHVSSFDERIYFIESNQATWLGGGDIAYVSYSRPLSTYHKLSRTLNDLFHSPCILPSGDLIASYRNNSQNTFYGLYIVNPETGKRQKEIFKEIGWHSIDVHILASHPKVKGRSNWLIPGTTTGVFYCLNSYRTNLYYGENIAPGTIKHVRVIEGMPVEQETYSTEAFAPQRILGVAPVEIDGSFHIRVPAEIPITFQMLDKNDMAIRTQKAWTWVMGNENRGCIGCHEDLEMAPPNKIVNAIMKPPVELTIPPEQRRTVDFRHQIDPMIKSKCAIADCHISGQAPPNFEVISNSRISPVYQTLTDSVQGREDYRYIVPGEARESPLMWHLLGEETGSGSTPTGQSVKLIPLEKRLKQEELILFIEWIDLGAQWDIQTAINVDTLNHNIMGNN